MEFDELRKIWDTQNNEPMYAINETTLHKRIHSYSKRTGRLAGINEVGLILISAGTCSFLLFEAIFEKESIYYFSGPLIFLLIAVFIFWNRLRRKKAESNFGQTMLGELDHAISNARYLVAVSKNFVWWFMLPAAVVTLPTMVVNGAPWYKWLFVLGCFALSWLVVRYELNRVHLPRLKKLTTLRDKIAQD